MTLRTTNNTPLGDRVSFEAVETIEKKDMAEIRGFLSAKNKVYSFIRTNNKKYYIHNISSNGYQFALSTDKTHKNREVNIKFYNEVSKLLKVATNLGLKVVTIDLNDKNEFYIFKKSYLIIKL